jgi:hypothetical protein
MCAILPECRCALMMKRVVLVRNPGSPDESRREVLGLVQAKQGFFLPDTPVFIGDVIETPDPRGGLQRLVVRKVNIHQGGERYSRLPRIPAPTLP